MKINRHGQSAPVDREVYSKVLGNLAKPSHKLIWQILFFTGERISAVVSLRIEDVFERGSNLRSQITFRGQTRKDKATRQCPIHKELRVALLSYPCCPSPPGYLFPSKSPTGHITRRVFDRVFRIALVSAGLDNEGFSLHGTRHGFITALHQGGTSLAAIQDITGHQDINSLRRYIKSSPDQIEKAIALR